MFFFLRRLNIAILICLLFQAKRDIAAAKREHKLSSTNLNKASSTLSLSTLALANPIVANTAK